MSNNSSVPSFLEKLFGSLFSSHDPEAEKKRQLKAIAKTLSKTKYKFYKSGADQVLPAYGKFVYEIYKAVSSAQLMFNAQPNPSAYKNLVVDYSLSERQKKLEEEMTEESIKTMSSNMPFAQLKTKVKQNLATFLSEFDQDKVARIDALYAKLMSFKQFCQYDFYFTIKKFDSSVKEGDFNRSPKFEPIDASYLLDDIKDFIYAIYTLPLDDEWTTLMTMFKEVKGSEPIKTSTWNKLILRLRQLKDSRVLDMMVQLISKDPAFVPSIEEKHESIIESYIDKITKQATDCIAKLEAEQRNSKNDSILTQIFNTTNVTVLKNYTEEGSAPIQKKNLGSFEYAKPLNYMKAFLVEYVKKEVREYGDLVLIRGQWTTPILSQQMSEAYHVLLETSDKITQFDEMVSEEGEFGMKFKTLLPRCDRDKESANIIRTTLGDCNSIAKEYIVDCSRALITFAKNTKALIEDYKKKKPEMLSNWKELERNSANPIDELGVEVYKKIYLITSLMQSILEVK